MVVYSSKRNWTDVIWPLIIFVISAVLIWRNSCLIYPTSFGLAECYASSLKEHLIVTILLFVVVFFCFILYEVFWKKAYKLELDRGLIKETYGKVVKQAVFKSLDSLDGTQLPSRGRGSNFFFDFHLTLGDGSKSVFTTRGQAKLPYVIKAVKEMYPETKISEILQKESANL